MQKHCSSVCSPPKTNEWTEELYKKKLENAIECLRRLLKEKDKILIIGDFNCKEVSWESWSAEGSEASSGSKVSELGMVLELVTVNFLTQWMKENTRFRGYDEPSRLDLIITRESDIVEEMNYKSCIGKSTHILIDYILLEGVKKSRMMITGENGSTITPSTLADKN